VPPAAIVAVVAELPATSQALSLAVKLALGGGCAPPSADADIANATKAPAASAARYSDRWRARRLIVRPRRATLPAALPTVDV
jgi:hypothetical protein